MLLPFYSLPPSNCLILALYSFLVNCILQILNSEGFFIFLQYKQFAQFEQFEQSEQFKQYKQSEQYEQFEQSEQFEQYEQSEQFEQYEQFEQSEQFELHLCVINSSLDIFSISSLVTIVLSFCSSLFFHKTPASPSS